MFFGRRGNSRDGSGQRAHQQEAANQHVQGAKSGDDANPTMDGDLSAESALASGAAAFTSEPVPKRNKAALPFVANTKVQCRLKDRNTAAVSMTTVTDAPYDLVFDLMADPMKHGSIFSNIQSTSAELLEECGAVRRWRVDLMASWRFWKVGGVCQNRIWMETDRDKGTVTFKLREPGFLRTYEGTWTITGPHGGGPGTAPRPAGGSGGAAGGGIAAAAGAAAAMGTIASGSRRAVGSALTRSLSSGALGMLASVSSAFTNSGMAGITTASGLRSHALHASMSPPASPGPSCCSSPPSFTSPFARAPQPCLTRNSATTAAAAAGAVLSLSSPPSSSSSLQSASLAGTPRPSLTSSASSLDLSTSSPSPPAVPSPQRSERTPPAGPAAGKGLPAAGSGPRGAMTTTIRVEKSMSPRVCPPFPLNMLLKGHAAGQVDEMLHDLLMATATALQQAN